jgi:hypothetical protein
VLTNSCQGKVGNFHSSSIRHAIISLVSFLALLNGNLWAQNKREYIYLDGKLIAVKSSDAISPTINITSTFTNNRTIASTISLSGAASDNVGVTQVTFVTDQGQSGTCSTTNNYSNWTCSISLSLGPNLITVKAFDAASNSATAAITITRDAALSIAITSPLSGIISNLTQIAVSGSTSGSVSQITWSTGVASGSCVGIASWSCSVALSEGQNSISITAANSSGNSSTSSITVIGDRTAPVITFGQTPSTTYSQNITVSANIAETNGLSSVTWARGAQLNGTCALASGSNWNCGPIVLEFGANAITITATDAAGNTASTMLTITRQDNEAPSVNITNIYPTSPVVYGCPWIAIIASVSDNVGIDVLFVTNDRGGIYPFGGTYPLYLSGNYAYSEPIILAPGSNTLTIFAFDAAGNLGTASIVMYFSPN